jgi:RNA polymerase sigma factor (sigma-70 family)
LTETTVARLFEEHHVGLYHHLVRLTGDRDLAADAAQEAFVRLLTSPPTLDAAAPADGDAHRAERAWLYRVATNVALEQTRTASRRRRLLAGAPARVPMADPAPAGDELAEARERHARVEAALAALPSRDRTALLMREAGFSHREIAAAVGTTTGSVGTVVARALARLAAALPRALREAL